MRKNLEQFIKNRNLCCIYLDSEDLTSFAVGYIIDCDDQFFAVESIDRYGNADGIFCTEIERIVKIESGSEYCCDIEKLFTAKQQNRFLYKRTKDKVLSCFLQSACLLHKICTIELCNSELQDIVGFIEDTESSCIKIKLITERGKDDGFTFVPVDKITQISIDSLDEQKIFTLYKLQQKLYELYRTIAHEIAHYFQQYFDEDEVRSDRSLEIEANLWAMFLVSQFKTIDGGLIGAAKNGSNG